MSPELEAARPATPDLTAPTGARVARLAAPVRLFLREYLGSGASQYAGMLAFSLFVAMVPLTVGVLTLWGSLSRSPSRFSVAKELVVSMFPTVTQGPVRQAVLDAGEHASAVALLSLAALLWFSTGVFSTTGFALNRIYDLPDRTMVQQRLRGLWLAPALFGAAYLAVGIDLAVRRWSVPGLVGTVAIWLTLTWLVGFLYRMAPSRTLPRANRWPGAGLAALVIVGLAYAFPAYAQLAGSMSSGSRFFTAVFGLVAWVYLIAQALLLGAVLNRCVVDVRGDPTIQR